MKKLCVTLLAALLLAACTGPMGPAGKDGDSTQWKVIDITVKATDWVYSNNADNNFFSATFSVPLLTEFIYDYGLTQCYVEYNKGTNNKTQQLLPSVRSYEVHDNASNAWIPYTQTIDYEYGVGSVTFFVTNSDFIYDNVSSPGAMDFRLVLMW